MSKLVRRQGVLALALLASCTGVGCGGKSKGGPDQTLRAYVKAIRQGQPRVAYGLLAEETRERVTLEEFVQRWKKAPGELEAQAQEIEASLAEKKKLKIDAVLRGKKGPPKALTYKAGRWRIASGVDIGGGGSTPREAIDALLKAAEGRDYLAVKGLMTRAVARAFEMEIDKRIRQVKTALKKAKIKVSGQRAVLRYRGYRLELKREGGRWRVADFD